MYELLREELKNNLNKKVLLFKKNGFRFYGVVLNIDDSSVKIDDLKSGKIEIISLDSIESITIEEQKEGGTYA